MAVLDAPRAFGLKWVKFPHNSLCLFECTSCLSRPLVCGTAADMILQLGTVLRNILSSCSRIGSKNIERNSFVSHGTFAHENGLCPLFLTHQYDAHYCPQRSAVFGSSVTHHSTAVSGTRFRSRAQSPSLITNSSP